MSADRILVPIDFTPGADAALDHAATLASKSERQLSLLHVTGSKEDPISVRDKLAGYASRIRNQFGVDSNIVSVKGGVLREIEEATRDPRYAFMVLATHGVKGIRQTLFGADALHIARHSSVPVIAIQEGNKQTDYSKIVFPYGGHSHFKYKIKATVDVAKAFNSTVHIYAIDRPGDDPTPQAKQNVADARAAFEADGIEFLEVHEDPSVMSLGFARQTIQYAGQIDAGLVVIMAAKTAEYSHIAQADKETMINNDAGIAVMLTSDRIGERD